MSECRRARLPGPVQRRSWQNSRQVKRTAAASVLMTLDELATALQPVANGVPLSATIATLKESRSPSIVLLFLTITLSATAPARASSTCLTVLTADQLRELDGHGLPRASLLGASQ